MSRQESVPTEFFSVGTLVPSILMGSCIATSFVLVVKSVADDFTGVSSRLFS